MSNTEEIIQKHSDIKLHRKPEVDVLRKQAFNALSDLATTLKGSVDESAQDLITRQKQIDSSLRRLSVNSKALKRQTKMWCDMIGKFNGALKALGDAEHVSAVIARDLGTVAETLQNIHQTQIEANSVGYMQGAENLKTLLRTRTIIGFLDVCFLGIKHHIIEMTTNSMPFSTDSVFIQSFKKSFSDKFSLENFDFYFFASKFETEEEFTAAISSTESYLASVAAILEHFDTTNPANALNAYLDVYESTFNGPIAAALHMMEFDEDNWFRLADIEAVFRAAKGRRRRARERLETRILKGVSTKDVMAHEGIMNERELLTIVDYKEKVINIMIVALRD